MCRAICAAGRAVVGADQVQAQVDARGGPGAGGYIAQVDVERVGLDLDLREAGGEFGGHPPVGGRPPAVQQPRLCEHEGAGADRDNAGAASVGLPDRVKHGGRGRFPAALQAGDDHGVRSL